MSVEDEKKVKVCILLHSNPNEQLVTEGLNDTRMDWTGIVLYAKLILNLIYKEKKKEFLSKSTRWRIKKEQEKVRCLLNGCVCM